MTHKCTLGAGTQRNQTFGRLLSEWCHECKEELHQQFLIHDHIDGCYSFRLEHSSVSAMKGMQFVEDRFFISNLVRYRRSSFYIYCVHSGSWIEYSTGGLRNRSPIHLVLLDLRNKHRVLRWGYNCR